MSLRYAVANVGRKVTRTTTTLIGNAAHHLIDKLHKVGTTRVRVAKGALDHDLRSLQIFNCPTHPYLKRVVLGGKRTHALTIKSLCHKGK
jgi:hypothetical protein